MARAVRASSVSSVPPAAEENQRAVPETTAASGETFQAVPAWI